MARHLRTEFGFYWNEQAACSLAMFGSVGVISQLSRYRIHTHNDTISRAERIKVTTIIISLRTPEASG